MSRFFHLLLLIALGLVGCEQQGADTLRPLNRNDIDKALSNPNRTTSTSYLDPETTRAFATEAAADIVVSYNGEEMMAVRDGPVVRRVDVSWPKPSKLVHYFDSRPRKNLVVVIFEKNVWSDARLQSEIAKTNRYFFARGYKRVVIQQARSSSRPTHSDVTATSSLPLKSQI